MLDVPLRPPRKPLAQMTFVKTYKEILDDEDDVEAGRAGSASSPGSSSAPKYSRYASPIGPKRPDVAAACCSCTREALLSCVSPFMRLPCYRRVARRVSVFYRKRGIKRAVNEAYLYMSTHGGVLRYASLFTAGGAGACAFFAFLVQGSNSFYRTDYIGLLLSVYVTLLEACIVMYEWPEDRFPSLHGWVQVNASALSRMVGRGFFILFLGTLAAANSGEASLGHNLLTAVGFLFGLAQMVVGGAMILLGRAIAQRMADLHAQLEHDPEEKAKLYSAFNKVDPTRRGSIHVGQLAALSDALQLEEDITDEAMEALEAPSGVIHLDEFRTWYAEQKMLKAGTGGGGTESGGRGAGADADDAEEQVDEAHAIAAKAASEAKAAKAAAEARAAAARRAANPHAHGIEEAHLRVAGVAEEATGGSSFVATPTAAATPHRLSAAEQTAALAEWVQSTDQQVAQPQEQEAEQQLTDHQAEPTPSARAAAESSAAAATNLLFADDDDDPLTPYPYPPSRDPLAGAVDHSALEKLSA